MITTEELEARPVGAVVRIAPRQIYTKVRQGNPEIKHYELTVWLKTGSRHGFKSTSELIELHNRIGDLP